MTAALDDTSILAPLPTFSTSILMYEQLSRVTECGTQMAWELEVVWDSVAGIVVGRESVCTFKLQPISKVNSW
jgi:hypothetical protein